MVTAAKVQLDSDASFEVCLAHALHGDWRRVMHIPSAMVDRRLCALCNAMIAFTSTHDVNKYNYTEDSCFDKNNNSCTSSDSKNNYNNNKW